MNLRIWKGCRARLCPVVISIALWLSARAATNEQPASTKRMVERLQRVNRVADPRQNNYLSDKRAVLFEMLVKQSKSPAELLASETLFARELLNAGRTAEAITEYAKLDALSRQYDPAGYRTNKLEIQLRNALSYLRLGEQENCLLYHGNEACLLPIRGNGIHQLPRGSRGAINILNGVMLEYPDDLSGRWLMNIAYMTLGEYPDKVPPKWLIPPKAFESEYPLPRFTNVADLAGLGIEKLAGGVVVDDFDNNGLLNVMTTSFGIGDQMRYFRNNGDGTFTETTDAAGLTGLVGGLNMIQADYNNDGLVDVFVLRGAWMGQEGRHPRSLLRNNGNGTFTDVTEEAGLMKSMRPTQTGVWLDYNNDGFIDLFIGNETTDRYANRCELYRNNGDGTFTEVAEAVGVANIGFVKGVTAGDFNNDGLPDLYLSRLNQTNILYRNDGPQSANKDPKGAWHFTDVTETAGVGMPLASFPCWFFDYDNDGWPDIFVCGYRIDGIQDVAAEYLGLPARSTYPKLYHNLGNGKFQDVTTEMNLNHGMIGMGANFGDLDNDGWLDFYIGTGNPDLMTLVPNRMFRNAEGKRFLDVTTAGGFGHLQKGHAVSFADINNDGHQDVFESMGGSLTGDTARNVLYLNPGNSNAWVTLKLEGTKSNRSAIGTRIKVNVSNPAGKRSIYRTVGSGGSFGCSPLRQEIGLGPDATIDSIEIKWPASGIKQEFKAVPSRQFYQIREDSAELKVVTPKPFGFGKRAPESLMHHDQKAAN